MTSQPFVSSLFSHKPLYPRQSVNISPFKCSKICMPIFPSMVRRSANTSRKATEEFDDHTMSVSKDIDSLLVDNHETKVTLPKVNVNNIIHELKEKTRIALTVTFDPTRTLELVDAIQRLGIGYHFHKEIVRILEKLTQELAEDLYTTALYFRLRRHNGLPTNASEVFNKYMDANGELKPSLSEDIEGLLSLYEASYLGSTGEDVLSNAKKITTRHLTRSISKLSGKLHKKVVEGLRLPRHMRMERLEARRYIEEYGTEDDHNPIVLEFAKYDYNKVQSVIQKELFEVKRWWEHLCLSNNLSFVRDRHVECFLWTVGALPEPSFSSTRIELAKPLVLLLVIDDIYDTYGSYDDLVLFTKAIKRWNLNEIEQLPEYMKTCYTTLYNTNNEICDIIFREKGLSVQPFLQKTWTDLVEAYMVEAEWVKKGRIPLLRDYLRNGVITSGTCIAAVHLFFFILDDVTFENTQRILDPYPKVFTFAGTILRLWDDLGTSKEEQKRGDMLSSIYLLMKEKNITCEEEGRKEILHVIYRLWKDMNVELVTPNAMLLPLIKVALNLSRASQVVYQHDDDDDSYLSSVKIHVKSLFYEPIDISSSRN